jgi:uncharacterized protein YwqG
MKDKDLFIPLPLAKFSSEILASLKSFIKISPEASASNLSVIQSKFAGTPYWPYEFSSYPKDAQGNPMKLVAQINFEEVYQSIDQTYYPPYFPNNGLLQFFLPQHNYDNSYWGICFDSKGNKSNDIAVIYHPTFNKQQSSLSNIINQSSNITNFPIATECKLKFSLDYHFCPLTESYNTKYFYSNFLDNLCAKQKIEFYEAEEFDSSGCKLNGYAHFNQEDPRTDLYNEDNPWILLLQIDSFKDNGKYICNWGNCGTANWFIRKNDLTQKDFSKILFHWDFS